MSPRSARTRSIRHASFNLIATHEFRRKANTSAAKDLQHAMFTKLFNNKLALAPIDTVPLHSVLDIATGTGIWAIEFAEENPHSSVLGTDLSPIQPSYVPPNLTFEVADAEDTPWFFPHPFDYIHARAVLSCFRSPLSIFQEAYRNLIPGGIIEFQDPIMPFKYAQTPPADSPFLRWNKVSMQAAEAGERRWDNVVHYKRLMEDAGFVDVTEMEFRVHTGPWSDKRGDEGKREKELGRWQLQNWLEGVEGMTIRNLARAGWKPLECQVLVAEVKEELLEGRLRAYSDVLAVWGRKPMDGDGLGG